MSRDTRQKTLQHLAQQLRRYEHKKTPHSCGDQLIYTQTPCDSFFPEGGISRGSLLEFLVPGAGSGVSWLLCRIATCAMQSTGNLVILDPHAEFHPPAIHNLGVALERTIFVRPHNEHDTLWALEQSLRCSGVAAVICCLSHVTDRTFRRFQLAAELGGTIGLFLRPDRFLKYPSWAGIRLQITPLAMPTSWSHGRHLQIEFIRSTSNNRLILEVNDETGDVHLVAQLASPESSRRSTGA